MLKISIEMQNDDEVDLKVEADEGNLNNMITATTSLIVYAIKKIHENPVAKAFSVPKEIVVEYILKDIASRLKDVVKAEEGEEANA